jgi:hypothetical protein
MAISLESLKRGKENAPPRIILAGSPGVGKTTFACSAPAPVVIQTEDGLVPLIDAGLLPEDLPRFPIAATYADVMGALSALYQEEHSFQTLVVDSLDWLEPLIWAKVCADHAKQSIEEFGYGKGYIEADRTWAEILAGLNALRRERGMAVVLTAHTEVKRFEAPDEPPYDRYQIKLHKRAHALVEEWADVIGTARFKNLISTETQGSGKTAKKTHKAVGQMERVLYTSERPSAVAKNRYGLPPELPLTWEAFSTALHNGNQPTNG